MVIYEFTAWLSRSVRRCQRPIRALASVSAHSAHRGQQLHGRLVVPGARDVERGGAVECGRQVHIGAVLGEQGGELRQRFRRKVAGAEDEVVQRRRPWAASRWRRRRRAAGW